MLIGVITDIHIFNETSFQEVMNYIKIHLENKKPDLMVCLGDIFDKVTTCITYAQKFKEECYKAFPHWIFIYGNHDGEYATKGEIKGWQHFLKVFPDAQARHSYHGQNFISVGDLEETSDYHQYLIKNAKANDIVLSHGPFSQNLLNILEEKGITLALSGHTHVFHIQEGKLKKIKQYSMPCLRIGGMNNEPACMTYVEIKNNVTKITCQKTPLPKLNEPQKGKLESFDYPPNQSNGFQDAPENWLFHPPLIKNNHKWLGGYSRLQYYEGNNLVWDKSYGHCHFNSTPLYLFTHHDKDYLVVSGTWGKSETNHDFDSAVIVDAISGAVKLYLPVVGLTSEPYIQNNLMVIMGQWHEVIAIDLNTMKILWQNTAHVNHPVFEWRDNRNGGGWGINAPIIGTHVWAVNLRGDVIGFDKFTGQRKFIHLDYVKVYQPIAYSQILGCGHIKPKFCNQKDVIAFENQKINDVTGEKILS